MNNHYVSQFIIKMFSNEINVFNKNNGIVKEKQDSRDVFYEKKIYSDEVETSLANGIEKSFSRLMYNKLLKEDETIKITREELFLIKRFMLVSSIRAQGGEGFRKILEDFEHNADAFFMFNTKFKDSKLPRTKDTEFTNKQLLNNAIKAYNQTKDIEDLVNNELCTREMVAFAAPFLLSYIAFWDSSDTDELILGDIGFFSEYEGVHQITNGLDLSKFSYLLQSAKKRDEYVNRYYDYLSCNQVMYENYDVVNLSKNRCLVMISPFFKLYFDSVYSLPNGEVKTIYTSHPDIWPAIIQNKELFCPPTVEYKVSPISKTKEDVFSYNPKKLTQEETIYINSIIIFQSRKLLGFDSVKKIYPSIAYFLYYVNYIEKATNKKWENYSSLFTNLIDWINSKENGLMEQDNKKIMDNYLTNIHKDFNTNIYIYEYLLDNYEQTYNCDQLDFLGGFSFNKDRKMEYLKKMYEYLKNIKC